MIRPTISVREASPHCIMLNSKEIKEYREKNYQPVITRPHLEYKRMHLKITNKYIYSRPGHCEYWLNIVYSPLQIFQPPPPTPLKKYSPLKMPP